MNTHSVEDARYRLQVTGRALLEKDLTWGSSGNLSVRLTSETFLITASGTQLGELGDCDFVICDIDRQNQPNGKPSKEYLMHAALYRRRPEIGAVLHASPFYSTLVACSNVDIPNNWFVESMYYLERVARVAYHHPGSRELADAVDEIALRANVFILENHGVLTCDSSIREALIALETLELMARMWVTARDAGIGIAGLPTAVVHDFLHVSGYRPRRKWLE